jgi:hypothetical protein
MAALARRRRAVAAKRGDATGMQFGIGHRPAFLLHALRSEPGITAHGLFVLLALPHIRSRAWVWWRLGRALSGKSAHQDGG